MINERATRAIDKKKERNREIETREPKQKVKGKEKESLTRGEEG